MRRRAEQLPHPSKSLSPAAAPLPSHPCRRTPSPELVDPVRKTARFLTARTNSGGLLQEGQGVRVREGPRGATPPELVDPVRNTSRFLTARTNSGRVCCARRGLLRERQGGAGARGQWAWLGA